jgi:hypothetical protein
LADGICVVVVTMVEVIVTVRVVRTIARLVQWVVARATS